MYYVHTYKAVEETGVILDIGNRKKVRKEHKMKRKIIPKKPYHTSGYYVTKHATYDMQKREITKGELGYNLRKKPLLKTETKKDIFGRPAYKRFSLNRILSVINPFNKNVCSVRRFHDKELRKDMEKYGKNKNK